jgi:prepilin-type N-terminal cleavage/methylation domain-containing protein
MLYFRHNYTTGGHLSLMANKIKKTQGFTIIELLLATVAFSIALLVALAAFLGIGKLFFKGVTAGQSQDTAKAVLDDISGAVRVAPAFTNVISSGNYRYICIGNIRYTYAVDNNGKPIMWDSSQQADYDPSDGNANFGLIRDKLPGSSACAAPCAPGGSCSAPFPASPTEMLSDQMRVGFLGISSSSNTINLYNVNLVLTFGASPPLNFNPDPNAELNSKVTCNGNLTSQQFCSVTILSTSVFRGIHT